MRTICCVPDCENVVVSHGYCAKHWAQMKRRGAVFSYRKFERCSAPGCDRGHFGFGYCEKHLDQIQRNGTLLKVSRNDPNECVFDGETARISFYKGNDKIAETIIDAEDSSKIKDYKWYLDVAGYVVASSRTRKRYTVRLHRLLLGLGSGRTPEVDHIDRDKLNNRKSNLRLCSRTENCWNKSVRKDNKTGINGVFWNTTLGVWTAKIYVNKRMIPLGAFKSLEKATAARQNAELKYYKKFAPQKHSALSLVGVSF